MHQSLLFAAQAQASASTEELRQDRNLQLPREVIQRLRNVIFGFDFFVSKVENYQANGVIFKGNLRGDPSVAYDRIAARLKVLLCYQDILNINNRLNCPDAVKTMWYKIGTNESVI